MLWVKTECSQPPAAPTSTTPCCSSAAVGSTDKSVKLGSVYVPGCWGISEKPTPICAVVGTEHGGLCNRSMLYGAVGHSELLPPIPYGCWPLSCLHSFEFWCSNVEKVAVL